MKEATVILMMAMATFGQAQTFVNYGANLDSIGQVFLIRQITTRTGDTTETRAVSVKFKRADEAVPTLEEMETAVRTDSIEIERLRRQNNVNLGQLAEIRKALKLYSTPTKAQQPEETELERLRRENAELKKKKN